MVSREEVIAQIQKVPDKHLDELYRIIKNYEEASGEEAAEQSVMAQLRGVKISAAPDFSIKADLYDLEEHNAK
jgi:lysozyme family protein